MAININNNYWLLELNNTRQIIIKSGLVCWMPREEIEFQTGEVKRL